MKNRIQERELFMARILIFLAPSLGVGGMLLFMSFLFFGKLPLISMELSMAGVVAWDSFLSLLFFIQHSSMIRRNVRSRMETFIPSHFHEAVFAMVSSVVLIVIVVFWQSSSFVVYELQGSMYWLARFLFLLAIAGIVWGFYSLKAFDPFGSGSIKKYMEGNEPETYPFSVSGPYLWVRHPLYFFVLILIWSFPVVTLDRLLFNLFWTLWMYLGAVLEEKDLVTDFGNEYRQYQKEVPMLIPWKKPFVKNT